MLVSADLTWLQDDVMNVAPRLLGWEVYSQTPEGLAGGHITEVEAYHGSLDPASHAFRGQTPRTRPMFLAGGAVYLYRSYGIHVCLNIVTGPPGEAQAVLIRAIEPTQGLDLMKQRRGHPHLRLLTNGPGKVGQALGLTLDMSGQQLNAGSILISPPRIPVDPSTIQSSPRIGIRVATDKLWRYYLAT